MDIKWVLFIIYIVVILGVGYWGYTKTKTLADFYLAGRKINKWIGAATFGATFVSAITFVGWVGFGWQFGTAIIPVYVLGCLLGFVVWAIVAPKINILAHRNAANTPTDFYAGRFDSSFLRLYTSGFTIVGFVIYLVIQLIGTGILFEIILGIPFATAVIILGLVYAAYTLLGGMKSVAWTDAIQFAVFIVATIVAFVYVLPLVGGLGAMNASLADIDVSLLSLNFGGVFSWLWIFGIFFSIVVVIPLHYGYIARSMACKSPREARGMIGIGSAVLMIFYIAIVVIALSTRVLIPDVAALPETDAAFPTLVLDFFPTVLGGVILAALAAAVMSTTDSVLLQIGSNAANDIYSKSINPDASKKRIFVVVRAVIVVFAVIAILLALTKPAAIWTIYNFFTVFLVCPYAAIFFLGLYWKRATKTGAIVGAVSGGAIGILVLWLQLAGVAPAWLSYHATLYAVPISMILMVIVSYKTKPLPERVLKSWF